VKTCYQLAANRPGRISAGVDENPDDLRLIADLAPVPMWVTGLDRRRTFVNRAYVEFLGIPFEKAMQFDWREILHPDDVASVIEQSNAGEGALTAFTLEGRYRRGDGQWRFMQSVSQPRFDSAGKHAGFIGVAHDVTDARLANLDVRRREEQLSAFVHQTRAGFGQVDLNGRFTLVNDRFCEITGYSREQLLDRTMQSITHPDDLRANLPRFEAAVRDGTPYTHEKRYIRPDGSIVWVNNSVGVVRAPSGTPYGVLAITFDVTDRRAADDLQRASERRLVFLDTLGRATASANDADAIMKITTRLLGEHLNLSDCAYADMEADEDTFHIRDDWHAPGAQSIVGTYSLTTFGSFAVANLHAGQPLIVNDNIAELGDDGAKAFLDIGIRATVCMPFVRNGKLIALMAIHAAEARNWTPEELALLREVTERSWAHIERVRSAAALRDSERRLRLAIEGARIGTWEWDLATSLGSWSGRTAEIMGVSPDERVTPELRYRLIHPDDRDRVHHLIERMFSHGDEFSAEYRLQRSDGTTRWVSSRGVTVVDENRRPTRLIGTIRDVTERRDAQDALSAINRTLEQQIADRTAERDRMWRLSRDLFIVVGRRREVRAINPAVALLGYTYDEVTGKRIDRYIHPDDLSAATDAIRRAMREPLGEFQARLRTKSGEWRQFSWSAVPGDQEAYVTGRDVTAEVRRRDELEQARDALRQAQKVESLGQLTGGVAHDFNNLLTPIIGNLDLLKRSAVASERDQRLVRTALESAERARILVQRLLAFARRQPLQVKPLDLRVLVNDMAGLIASTSGPQIRLNLDLPTDLPNALADANQLEMAILNLSVNARDAMPDGGTLTIAAARRAIGTQDPSGLSPGDYVTLSVSDTGTGMSEDVLARAIDPFFSTKGIGRGTGLGLSMVHGLASQLGGILTLSSRLGLGTTIELILPAAATNTASSHAAVAADPRATGAGTILVVDDDEAVRATSAAIAEDLGYAVVQAGSAGAALTALATRSIDLLLTDHLMPRMTGVELIREVRLRYPDLPALIVTGYADLDAIPPDIDRLAKPFRREELGARLARLSRPTE
jgi:PAS domain S-box-containing protein